MVFNNGIQPEEIAYLCEFIPNNVDDFYDKRSHSLVLAFKDGNRPDVINRVAELILPNLGSDFVMVGMPSSEAGPNICSASISLISKIMSMAPDKRLADASSCFYRKTTKIKSCLGGSRDPRYIESTLALTNSHLFRGRDVLVVDDVFTTGASMQVAFKMLKEAGARNVYGITVGKTRSDECFRYGFILDLDMTLFDTAPLELWRKLGRWDDAIKRGREIQPILGVETIMQKIRDLDEADICIVTNSPRHYAEAFAERLGISKIVAYHDTTEHKPGIMPYAKAKAMMGIYEPCITVIGDQENDIIPGNEMAMNTVRICSTGTETAARHNFSSMEVLAGNFESVLKPVRGIRNKLLRSSRKEE